MRDKCACFYPEADDTVPDAATCACGHEFDEHDVDGECQAEVEL